MRPERTKHLWHSHRGSLLAILLLVAPQATGAEPASSDRMPKTYSDVREFLRRHTKVLELAGEGGALVTICPEYQGRVMTSTCDGPGGHGLGWVNFDFIAAGKHSPAFNNYGGEDRFWIGPGGGNLDCSSSLVSTRRCRTGLLLPS
jgi:hypothetical protein